MLFLFSTTKYCLFIVPGWAELCRDGKEGQDDSLHDSLVDDVTRSGVNVTIKQKPLSSLWYHESGYKVNIEQARLRGWCGRRGKVSGKMKIY